MHSSLSVPKSYFLALGAGRGGTTLLANCLDSHPQICCLNGGADDALRGRQGLQYMALRQMARVPLVSRLAARFERWVDRRTYPAIRQGRSGKSRGQSRARAFYGAIHPILTAQAKPVSGDKITTDVLAMIFRPNFEATEDLRVDQFEQARRDALADFCNQLFSAYRFVFIVRDGRQVLGSKVRRANLPEVAAAARWLECARTHRVLASILTDRLMTLTFETLIAQPERTLQTVCAFLEVEYDERMLTGAQRSYKNEAHQGFERQALARQTPRHYDDLLREGLLYFEYPL